MDVITYVLVLKLNHDAIDALKPTANPSLPSLPWDQDSNTNSLLY